MKVQRSFRHSRPASTQRGYILLTLMLFVSLLAIAAVAIAPTLAFQIKRDREEELIHRGVQYSRAIRKYFKKFGRYPTRMEDLESTNNLRFLRKRYKDPITGKDFKLLHFGEVQMAAGGGIPGATPASAMPGASGASAAPTGASPSGGFSLGPTTVSTSAGQPATDSNALSTSANPNAASTPGPSSAAGNPSSPLVVGSGPIVGVTSTSKNESIRAFADKNHYNQWQFTYDPATDMNRGGLINTPAQPMLQNAVAAPGLPGAPGMPGAMGAGAGTSPFGSGMGNGMTNGPMGGPSPAQNPPPPHPQGPSPQ